MTTVTETFGSKGLSAREVHAAEVDAVLAKCRVAMEAGKPATVVAAMLRSSYRRLVLLAAAVEVIEDEERDPVSFAVVDDTPSPGPRPAPRRPRPQGPVSALGAPLAAPAGAHRAEARRAQRAGIDSRHMLLFPEGLQKAGRR